jgi:hypothetical protein
MNLEARILELLVAGGLVSEEKVEQANKLALSLKWKKSDRPSLTYAQKRHLYNQHKREGARQAEKKGK